MLKEYAYSFLLLIFFIFTIDFALSISNNIKNKYKKQTSLFAFLILCINNKYENIQNKKKFINRFLVIASSCLILIFINIYLIHQNLIHERIHIYFLFVGIICSLIHSFFSLLSNDLITIYKNTDLFRLRLIISLIFLSIGFLISLTQNTILATFYILICLMVLSYVVNLNCLINKHQNPFSLQTNLEHSFGLNRLYYYIFGVLEIIFFISIIINLLQIYKSTYLDEYMIVSYLFITVIIVLLNKFFLNKRALVHKKFIESDLLVTVFFIFGLAKLLSHIV